MTKTISKHRAVFDYHGPKPEVVDPSSKYRTLQDGPTNIKLGDHQVFIDFERIGDWQKTINGKIRAALLFTGGDRNMYLEREHPDGPPRIVDEQGRPLDVSVQGMNPEDLVRDPKEMQTVIQALDARKVPAQIRDADGNLVCNVDYDPVTGDPYMIDTVPFENSHGQAEHYSEFVCTTDEAGTPLSSRCTRKEAREQQRRYLVVSLLLFHNDKIGVGRRSGKKDIDPGQEAISAHGVASLLCRSDGESITDIRYAALVNVVRELNEELRHGLDTRPFRIVVWPGTERELLAYARANANDDSNTVYLAGGMLVADDGYPLNTTKNPRTRFIVAGYVFSKRQPDIFTDPGEVDDFRWMPLKEFAALPGVSEDGIECAVRSYQSFLSAKTQWGFSHSDNWIRRTLSSTFGDRVHPPPLIDTP
jgi:hypothetical protein